MNIHLVIFLFATGASSDCAEGHKTCRAQVGSTSYCKRQSNTCHAAPTVECHCGTTPSPHHTMMLHRPARASEHVHQSAEGMFLFLEWPSLQGRRAWIRFYHQVLQFIHNNAGGFRFSRIIARVNHPDFDRARGHLWQVGTDSVFFLHFLSRIPPGIEIHVYPYMHHGSSEPWALDTGASMPLEGVFKYVSEWNQLLALEGLPVRISGIVVDIEDELGFKPELPSIPAYRDAYSVPVRFGLTVAFDLPHSCNHYPNVDDLYLEMYDFYDKDTESPIFPGRHLDDPGRVVAELEAHVLGNWLLKSYRHQHLHFMWSLQSVSSDRCLYPLKKKNTCGDNDDFGLWTAPAVAAFIAAAKARFPHMRNKPHGLFQFSFVPNDWMDPYFRFSICSLQYTNTRRRAIQYGGFYISRL